MKKSIFIFLVMNLMGASAWAQVNGSIQLLRQHTESSRTADYVYTPPNRLSLPENLFISIAYLAGEENFLIKKPLTKNKGKYSFTFSPPETVKAFVLSVTDEKQKTIDNNKDSGYIIFCNREPKDAAAAREEAISLLSVYAGRALNLYYPVQQSKLLALHEEAFRLSPLLREDHKKYRYYLFLLSGEKGDSVAPVLLQYAQKMEALNDEASLETAIYIYRKLRLHDTVSQIEKRVISMYPTGMLARDKFSNAFYDKKGKTEESILADIREYTRRFGDTSMQMKYTFYPSMIRKLFVNKKYDQLPIYDQQFGSHPYLQHLYRSYANEICDEDNADSSGNRLPIARHLIQRTMQIITSAKASIHPGPDDITLLKPLHQSMETYARVLFTQKQFDSAYYYQLSVVENSVDPATVAASAEKLITYAVKARGDLFARNLAIKHLQAGNYSKELLEQFEQISLRLGIKDSVNIRESLVASERENRKSFIINRFGSQQAKDFSLTDLSGKTVTLSSFKNKIIVFDFWASWCGPCLASFPHMQEVVKKYEKDSSVVILLINSFENTPIEKMRQDAITLLQNNKYEFKVLLDDKNAAATAYKVNAIPAIFLIDKKGKLVFMSHDNSTIEAEIEYAKK